jgi:pentatricopeptide repeat protein
MVGKVVIAYFVLLGFVVNAQPLDTLKIKAEADSLKAVADSLNIVRENFEAYQYYQQAMVKYHNINHIENEIHCLAKMGGVNHRLGDFSNAIMNYKNCILKAKLISDNKLSANNRHKFQSITHRVGKGESLGTISKRYGVTINNLASKNKIKNINKIRANQILQIPILSDTNMVNEHIGNYYNNIGFNYFKLSEYQNAISYYDSSLTVRKKLNDKINIAKTWNNLGVVYQNLAEYEKAMNYYDISLSIRKELDDSTGVAKVLTNMGGILGKLNNYRTALENYFEESLSIRRDLNQREEEGYTLLNMGVIYMNMKEYYMAEKLLKEGLSIFKNFGNRELEGIALVNLGQYYFTVGEYDKSRKYYNEGYNICRELNNKKSMVSALRGIGLTFLNQEFYKPSKDNLFKALELADEVGAKDEVVNCQFALGKYYFSIGEYRSAISRLELALDSAGEIKKGLFKENYQLGYIRSVIPIYKMIISSFLKIGKTDKAFSYVEKMKARVLLDILEGGPISEEEIPIESGKGEPITMRKAKRVLSKDEAAVYFIIMENELITFVLTRKGLEVKSQNINKEDLLVLVKRIRLATKSQLFTPESWDTRASNDLYELLISPIEPFLKDKNRICIIPDDYLNYLPFHALQDKNTGKYLIEEYAIYYVPSLSTYSWLRVRGTSASHELLAFGNPEFETLDTVAIAFRGKLQKLPATENEVSVLETIYQPEVQIFTGLDANEANFKMYAEDFGVLHLATHAQINENSPMRSSICLAAYGNEDGFLEAREIMKMEINSYLVVLSACKTAYSSVMEGEGMLGLTRAFFSAGVPSVVASLWSVEDNSTSELMVNFHDRVRKGRMPCKALQEAQLYLLRETEFKNPFFWAPFVLIGDPGR